MRRSHLVQSRLWSTRNPPKLVLHRTTDTATLGAADTAMLDLFHHTFTFNGAYGSYTRSEGQVRARILVAPVRWRSRSLAVSRRRAKLPASAHSHRHSHRHSLDSPTIPTQTAYHQHRLQYPNVLSWTAAARLRRTAMEPNRSLDLDRQLVRVHFSIPMATLIPEL